jgi:predicted MFS family arabinose efflux permease
VSTPCASASDSAATVDVTVDVTGDVTGEVTDVPPESPTSSSWAPITALALGIGTLVTSEFLPASVLPTMADDLGVSDGVAGLAVAATAVAGAVTALTIGLAFPRTDRRRMLVGLLALATASNLTVAAAPTFGVLLAARLLLGVSIAGYWSFAFRAGTSARPGRDHIVSTALAGGVSMATVVAVPLGSVAGDAIGWRVVFLGAAVLSAVSTAAVAAQLPPVPAPATAGLAMLKSALGNRRLVAGIVGVMLVALGNFAAYPYIRVAIDDVASDGTSWLLLAWGVAGLAGNLAAGGQSGRLRPATAAAPVLLATGLTLSAGAHSGLVLALGVVVWGFAFNMVPVLTQLWVSRVESGHAESALALQVTAFQVAITIGAVVGGAVVDAYDVQVALLLGAACAVASGLVFAVLRVPRD